MREAFRELGRDLDQPLATFEEAFKPSNFVVLEEVDCRSRYDCEQIWQGNQYVIEPL
jgi:hypothetical protein